jgi:hypothetical protein
VGQASILAGWNEYRVQTSQGVVGIVTLTQMVSSDKLAQVLLEKQ